MDASEAYEYTKKHQLVQLYHHNGLSYTPETYINFLSNEYRMMEEFNRKNAEYKIKELNKVIYEIKSAHKHTKKVNQQLESDNRILRKKLNINELLKPKIYKGPASIVLEYL